MKDTTHASIPQPPPVTSSHTPIIDIVLNDLSQTPQTATKTAVMADLRERAEDGIEKYGTYLQPFNSRDALWDAYQENLDLIMYLRQAIVEASKTPFKLLVAYQRAMSLAMILRQMLTTVQSDSF